LKKLYFCRSSIFLLSFDMKRFNDICGSAKSKGKKKAIDGKNMIHIKMLKKQQRNEKREFGVKVYESFEADNMVEADNLFQECKAKINELNYKIVVMREANASDGFEVKEDDIQNYQFGVNPELLRCTNIECLKSPIPTVLVDLKEILVKHDGYRTTGIFRISPDRQERDTVKAKINSGFSVDEATNNVHVAATLIGSWFRELPNCILDGIERETIEKSKSKDQVVEAHNHLREPQRSIILWLWDLLAEVSKHSEINKMDTRNLVTVISPCLFKPSKFPDPMLAMTYSRKVLTFSEIAVNWRSEKNAMVR